MRYLPLTETDREDMLARIGVPDVDALFSDVPNGKLLKEPLDLPRAKGELEVERILGRVRQCRDARQREEARAALDRVDEAENRVELRAVGGIGFPRHERPASFGKVFRRFGQKIVQKIVHRGTGAPQKSRLHHGGQWLMEGLYSERPEAADSLPLTP